MISSSYGSKSPLTKLIKVSAEVLLREWNGKETFDESDEDDDIIDSRLNKWSDNVSGPSKLAMKKLDYSIRMLRQCSTMNSLQKASIQVALALLDVSTKKECRTPFLCLNQAAVFASQGSKGGNNDEDFKKPLPREAECTAEEALHILGRADCLRAIHFTNEAMFLCSYVARVCCLHRDKKEADHLWTPKWRIIGIMIYTISVGIDSIIFSLMEGESRRFALESWENPVRAEIGRGRSDAIAMQKAFGRLNSSVSRQTSAPAAHDDKCRSDANGDVELDDDEEEEEEGSWDEGDGGNEDEEEEDDEDEDEDEDMDAQNYEAQDEVQGAVNEVPHNGEIDHHMIEYDMVIPPLPAIDDTDYAHIPTVEI